MNTYFYIRISTVGQNTARQIQNFKTMPTYNAKNLFIDKIQGDVLFMERPQGAKLFDIATSSPEPITIVVDSIDRLGRDLIDVLNTVKLFTSNGVNIKSLKEGFETLLSNGKENPVATIVIATMGSIAQMERNRIKERTREGIAVAKAKGKYTGRKIGTTQSDDKLLSRHKTAVDKLKKGLLVRDIVKLTGKSSATVIKVKKVLEARQEL